MKKNILTRTIVILSRNDIIKIKFLCVYISEKFWYHLIDYIK